MSNPKSLSPKERKIPHNWTKDTLGKCAITHMEQLSNVYFNYASPHQRHREIGRIIESYYRIEVSVLNGYTFTMAPEFPEQKRESAPKETAVSESEKRVIDAITEATKDETKRIIKIINKLRTRLKAPSYL